MEHTANQILLRGTLLELPQFSHENHNKRYFRFLLEVERLSGAVDRLPVLVSEQVLGAMDVSGGSMVEVSGQIRSFNSRASTGRKLVISVHADRLETCDGEAVNQVALTGTVCREPVYRSTPLGREICDVMLAVNRPYHRADYIPCIFWGRTAETVSYCSTGSSISLTGRLQSRDYIKTLEQGSENRTAYEVSVMTVDIF